MARACSQQARSYAATRCSCPQCGSEDYKTVSGFELAIGSIDVLMPDELEHTTPSGTGQD